MLKCLRPIFTKGKRLNLCKMSTKTPVDIADLRKPYNPAEETFDVTKPIDPFNLFFDWFGEVLKKDTTVEANAMCIATATSDGKPSIRMVLLKGYSQEGFTFYTSYSSRKGIELQENPEAYILFYWPLFQRQVRIEGRVEKVSEEESIKYFARRPRDSQISACASAQSSVVSGKEELYQKRKAIEKEFENKPIEKPCDWGGYLLRPRSYEFWQGQTDRFHDRILFRKDDGKSLDEKVTKNAQNGWVFERLCP